MEMTIKKCTFCESNKPHPDTGFCSNECFEMWYSIVMLAETVEEFYKKLNEVIGKKNANTGGC